MAPTPSALLGRLKRRTVTTFTILAAYLAVLGVVLDEFWDRPEAHYARAKLGIGATDRAQVGTVIQVGVIGLAILIIILVYSQVNSSLPTPSNTDLSNAQTNSTQTFAQAMELAPVIMIVLLAAVVIAVVQRFRS